MEPTLDYKSTGLIQLFSLLFQKCHSLLNNSWSKFTEKPASAGLVLLSELQRAQCEQKVQSAQLFLTAKSRSLYGTQAPVAKQIGQLQFSSFIESLNLPFLCANFSFGSAMSISFIFN